MGHVYPITPDQNPSEAVITAVADMVKRSPLDLDPIIETIDPDALNSILHTADGKNSTVSVSFNYGGCDIVVTPVEIRIDRAG